MSYSWWLQPPVGGALHAFATSQIELHAAQLRTVRFAPHVTLLGGVAFPSDAAAVAATTELARRLAGLKPRCRVSHAEAGRIFYQCVYLRCGDDEALSKAHALAQDVCGLSAATQPTYMPHLSLIYGNVDEAERSARVETVASALRELTDSSFLPSSVYLWRTPAGKTEDWALLSEEPF